MDEIKRKKIMVGNYLRLARQSAETLPEAGLINAFILLLETQFDIPVTPPERPKPKIYVFSNVDFSDDKAPAVKADDLLVFLNKGIPAYHYKDHEKKVCYHRSPKEDYGEQFYGMVHRYVFDGGAAGIPRSFIDELKGHYDWDYQIEQGKVKCTTTGYMVVKYLAAQNPDSEIILVNFGYKVKNSTYRCPYHNWKFEDQELSAFQHIYTDPMTEGGKKRIWYDLYGWLGDHAVATAIVDNVVKTGRYEINVAGTERHGALWEDCPILNRDITRDNADIVIKQHYPYPWDAKAKHYLAGTLEALAQDINDEIPLVTTAPVIWTKLPPERLIEEPYILINAGWQRSSQLKKWSRAHWEALVASLPFKVVQIGQRKNHSTPIPGAVDMIDQTDLKTLMRLIRDAACVVSSPSGCIHIAGGMGVPFVSIAGGREPASMVTYPCGTSLSTAGSLDCCKNGGCHRRDFGACAHPCDVTGEDTPTAQCMLDITPEAVKREIDKLLQKKGA